MKQNRGSSSLRHWTACVRCDFLLKIGKHRTKGIRKIFLVLETCKLGQFYVFCHTHFGQDQKSQFLQCLYEIYTPSSGCHALEVAVILWQGTIAILSCMKQRASLFFINKDLSQLKSCSLYKDAFKKSFIKKEPLHLLVTIMT